ncbi:M23 family metallopeptidase [Enterobacter cloacae]|uniref:M23 family metallopeptidase n=1 Tax=Enterobacter cloacae complex TaxID=354276 RepID=UPI002148FD8E|nr:MULTISPECIES: M23 family metallopeptidase [Enterobacter cloacae complex]MCR6728268.1 M23 family metallopeptidase [Enterobacter cloacae]UUR79384.1 M23 family metallopeptidase [Enterobacter cloacae complex sp. R_G8]
MIISPPFLRNRTASQTDADWTGAMMPVNTDQGFPLNGAESWHGGAHITHTDEGNSPEKIRAIADGVVVSFRQPSSSKDAEPLNYRGPTDDGYVLLKHETEIGSGEDGKVVFYSLYMHMKFLEAEIKQDAKIYRKAPLGSSGMCSGQNEFHFQIFCDDDNISKLAGRTTRELDVSKDGRTDAVYGDIHFYLPAGTKFYDKAPADNSTSITGLSELYTSSAPLYVSMTLAQGSCTMVTRQKNTQTDGKYDLLGDPLVNADGEDYEYNLYKTAMRNYMESPSAGFELLRFGRVINTEHETLAPADAPLWMTVNYPGGKGMVNLADANIKKFSDADFPHWTGWQLVDDDADSNSQCSSAIIRKLQEDGEYNNQCGKLICHFPFEWEKSTIDTRFSWLKTGDDKRAPMTEADYAKFKAHAEALCFDSGAFSSGRLWHFNSTEFIKHLRRCGWLSHEELSSMIPRKYYEGYPSKPVNVTVPWATSFGRWEKYVKDFNNACNKYNIISPLRRSAFLGQIYIETGMLRTMTEGGKGQKNSKGKFVSPAAEYYQPFYGRGFMQLTWPQNFDDYRKFRTVEKLPDESSEYVYDDDRITNVSEHYWADPRKTVVDKKTREKHTVIDDDLLKKWHPRYDPKIIAEDSFCATDSAGFYWVSKHHSHEININRVPDNGITSDTIGKCSVLVNGGGYGYFERQAYTRFAFYYLNDAVNTDSKEIINVQKGRNTVKITVDYTKQCE